MFTCIVVYDSQVAVIIASILSVREEMSSLVVTDEMVKKLKEYAAEFTKDLPKESLMSCEELWRLMNESDEYVLLVDTRIDVEMNVSKIKGAISYVSPLELHNSVGGVLGANGYRELSLYQDDLLLNDRKAKLQRSAGVASERSQGV